MSLYDTLIASNILASGSGGGGGTTVIANPTLAGSEDNLTGIQVDSTKYALKYLPTAGGDVSGAIKLSGYGTVVKDSQNNALINFSSDVQTFGNGNKRTVIASNSYNLSHKRGSSNYDILDSYNTSANPGITPGLLDLTSIKINGTSYVIPSGGGGSSALLLFYDSNSNNLYSDSEYTQVFAPSDLDSTIASDDLLIICSDNCGVYPATYQWNNTLGDVRSYSIVCQVPDAKLLFIAEGTAEDSEFTIRSKSTGSSEPFHLMIYNERQDPEDPESLVLDATYQETLEYISSNFDNFNIRANYYDSATAFSSTNIASNVVVNEATSIVSVIVDIIFDGAFTSRRFTINLNPIQETIELVEI